VKYKPQQQKADAFFSYKNTPLTNHCGESYGRDNLSPR